LLRFRFDRRLDSHADDALVDPALSPRANQILVPLLSIIPDAAARAEVKQAVADAERMRRASRSRTVEVDVLEIVVELAAASDRPIPLSDICTRFADRYHGDYDRPLSSRYIGNILRTRLGLFSYKSHGTFVVVANHERLTRLAERFGVESESR
jgi:hypothetical protein